MCVSPAAGCDQRSELMPCLHAGAAAIDGQILARIEVHGKQLFYFWTSQGGGSPHVVVQVRISGRGSGGVTSAALCYCYYKAAQTLCVTVQIHFGMSGAFRVMAEDKVREERPTTRLVLRNEELKLLAHLSAMTVEFGGPGELTEHRSHSGCACSA